MLSGGAGCILGSRAEIGAAGCILRSQAVIGAAGCIQALSPSPVHLGSVDYASLYLLDTASTRSRNPALTGSYPIFGELNLRSI